jgi:hypothetical protein
MKKLTTTIQRRWLTEIVAGTKKIEYRERKPFWDKRLQGLALPLELRMINGMNPPMPEVTVRIDKITLSRTDYKLHIGKILKVKNWPSKKAK